MDCSVKDTRYSEFKLVQTTDFFYPLVDDPYLQGKIGCANVLSDLYAMGIDHCDNMLMLLAASDQMTNFERNVVTKLMIKGFVDQAKEGGTTISGGQTVINPWPIIGGVASTVCKTTDFIEPVHAVPGDVLVLTKPLGTQVAVNAHQWLHMPAKWTQIEDVISKDEVVCAYEAAMSSMARLNKNGAKLMRKYQAHGATDVTGFGILGHASNLAKNQNEKVAFELHTLPIIRSMKEVDEKLKMFSLLEGFSAETSGGLLVCLPQEKAKEFCKEIEELDGCPAWIIGTVVSSEEKKARIVENVSIISV